MQLNINTDTHINTYTRTRGARKTMNMSDEELVKHIETLIFQPGFKFTTLNDIVHRLESQLGFNLSQKTSFIGEQVTFLLASVYPVYPDDHFTPGQKFHSQGGKIKASELPKRNHFVNPDQKIVLKAGADSRDAETKGSAKRYHRVSPKPQMGFKVKVEADPQDTETKGSDGAKRNHFVNPDQKIVFKAEADSRDAEIKDSAKRYHRASPKPQMGFKVKVEADPQDTETKGSDGAKSVPAKKRGGAGGLNKVCGVTSELQVIVGQPALQRTEIVKQLWAYIRRNKLQDPRDKRKIICDDALRAVFETDCTDMFKMNKLLSKHIIRLEPPKHEEESNQAKKMKVGSVDGGLPSGNGDLIY